MVSELGTYTINRFSHGEAAGYPTLCKGRFDIGDALGYAFEDPCPSTSWAKSKP